MRFASGVIVIAIGLLAGGVHAETNTVDESKSQTETQTQNSDQVSPTPEATPAASPTESEPVAVKKEISPESKPSTKTRGLLGPILIGPTFSTISVPTILRVGIEAKIYRWFGLSFEYGMIPKLAIQGVNVEANATTVSARFYPFRKSFFIGAGMGSQVIKAKKTQRIQNQDITGSLDVTTPFLTPEFGWRWVWASGFMMGMEFGYQISQGSNVAVNSDAPSALLTDPNYVKLENDIKDAGNGVGNSSLPHFALLQLGYFF